MSVTAIEKHLDPALLPLIRKWLAPYRVRILLTRTRQSKHGDFRAAYRTREATITLNRDLKPLQFLLTLTHEIAHLMVWHEYASNCTAWQSLAVLLR